jgi:hypothetical protein
MNFARIEAKTKRKISKLYLNGLVENSMWLYGQDASWLADFKHRKILNKEIRYLKWIVQIKN